MSDPEKPAKRAPGAVRDETRSARLKAALKANIARRKDQARARNIGTGSHGDGADHDRSPTAKGAEE